MVAIFRPALLGRRLKSTASVAAMIVGAITFAPQDAVAGDVTVNSNYGQDDVYGNSVAGHPETVDTSASASGNNLILESGASASSAYGAKAGGAANHNSVVMNGGNGGDIYGGRSGSGGATDNSVTVNGGTAHTVVGGFAGSGSAIERNSVVINGGTVSDDVYGAWSITTESLNNTVEISGGQVGTVVGGYAQYSSAKFNSVTISGGTLTGAYIAGGQSVNGSATDNTVTISGSPVITNNNLKLYGGYCVGACGDMFAGNRLELKTAGLSVAGLSNFQYLDFYLPTSLASGGTMLTVSGTADLTNGSGTSSTVNVGINGASSALAVGDSVTLIHAGTLITNADLNDTATGSGMLGVTLKYVFGISADANDLTATVQSVGVSEESKALSEGFVSGASFVNQGADLASGKGMANAISAAEAGWSSFGAVSGGSIRTETGSHVDVDGVSLLAGLSKGVDLSIGRLTTGVFAEFGNGSYDTYNGFSSGNVHGEGDSRYVGGGLLGHMDFDAAGPGHAYAEASARFGSAHTSFDSADLTSGGVAAGYDTSSLYAGASVAVGYVWTVNEATTVDVSGKYLWSRLGSDSVQLTTGETVDFDAVTSERTRLGARLSYALSNKVTPYAGAAWEHEFDGKSRATTNGFAIDAPSMGGDTGIMEVGLTLKPSDDLPLSVDLGLQGFVGQREGVAGNLQARLAF
ncbi:autotransporter domain-containing protein [Pleomorphomonas sp. PLEO]|uniref:autotransporter domain-containing protein n=1 Tax=Pleomorphomonas sp. PLEO TaxID=3239306 RepID=UPI00351DD63A